MPLITDLRPTHASPYLAPPAAKPLPAPSLWDTFTAGMRLENDVVNAIELMRKPAFVDTPDYPLGQRLKEEGLWDFERDDFVHVRSEEEFQWTVQRRNREKKDRNTLAAAGWGGVAAAVSAGLISPTLFIPAVGPAARAGNVGKALMEGAGLMAMAAGAQEGILFANQETRGAGEAVVGITAATVLGSILGGGVAQLRKGELTRMARDMVDADAAQAISHTIPNHTESSAGARQVQPRQDPGGLKAGPANWMSGIGPVTRGIRQNVSPLVRWMTSQFSDAGVRRERAVEGVIAAEGGTIENNIKTYRVHIQQLKNDTDELYNDYVFNGAPPAVGATARGVIQGLRTPGKLSKREFREAVTRATWANDEHAIPQVAELAKRIRTQIYDPLFKEAQEVGLYKDVEDLEEVLGDASYGMRMYNTDYISAHFNRFVDILANHVKKKLDTEFQGRLEKLAAATKRDEELVEDLTRPASEIAELRRQFQEELQEIERQTPEHLRAVEDDIETVEAERRKIPKMVKGVEEAKQPRSMLDVELKDLLARGGEPLKELRERRRTVKRRLRNLNRAIVVLTERHAKKLAKIERSEELQLSALNRAVRAGQKFLAEIKGMTDKEWTKKTKVVRERFLQAVEQFDRSETRLVKLMQQEDPDFARVTAQEDVLEGRRQKVLQMYERVDELDSFDRPAWTKAIEDGLNEALERTRDINARRAVRAARLEEQAKALDPAVFGKKLDAIKARVRERGAKLTDDFRQRSADTVDIAGRTADFAEYSRKVAEDTAHKILGSERRIAFNDIIQNERGPELARTLDIPSEEIAEFLNTDIDQIVRTYVRTLSSDISIARKFGRPDAAEYFKQLTEEHSAATRALENAKDKKGEPLSDAKKAQLSQNLDKFYREARHDLHVLLERAKGIRGIPKDPRGWGARAATTALNLNVLRYMGGVLLASVSDPARVIQKYGLMRTMSHTIKMVTGGWKEIRMSQREAQLAGAALDVVLHSRAHAMYDIFDELRHGTKAEKALEWATHKIGMIALFDYWTQGWKQFAAGIENVVVLEALSKRAAGKATKKDIENLAARNIDDETADIIWEQVSKNNGGAQVNGVWMPQTDSWDVSRPEVQRALRTYRSGLVGTIDDTIVTPGFERPNWIDSGIAGRLFGQFRSFALSSTTKTLMSGMQQRDMAYFNGTMISLALGALSYYLWATATGGKAYEEMMEAPIEKWVDEMITRSGQTAALDEVQRLFQRVPGISPYASFSGTRSTRREGGDLSEAIMGPSWDLFEKMNTVIMGADDPTRHTLHTLRQLIPFQNLFFLRQAFDMLEAAADLPEERESKSRSSKSQLTGVSR